MVQARTHTHTDIRAHTHQHTHTHRLCKMAIPSKWALFNLLSLLTGYNCQSCACVCVHVSVCPKQLCVSALCLHPHTLAYLNWLPCLLLRVHVCTNAWTWPRVRLCVRASPRACVCVCVCSWWPQLSHPLISGLERENERHNGRRKMRNWPWKKLRQAAASLLVELRRSKMAINMYMLCGGYACAYWKWRCSL